MLNDITFSYIELNKMLFLGCKNVLKFYILVIFMDKILYQLDIFR